MTRHCFAIVFGGLAAPAFTALAACSSASNTHTSNCGPGTRLSDGTCYPVDSGSDTSASDGPSGSDGQSDGAMDAPTDVMTGSDASTEQDASIGSMDDPCPTQTLNYLNCSTTCGPQNTCSNDSCAHSGVETQITSWSQLPYVIRTPSHPGMDQACPTNCGVVEDYALTVLIMLPPMGGTEVEVTVGPPWHVANWGGGTGGSSCPFGDAGACGQYLINGTTVGVWTDDPNAPARNVVIAPATTMCP
jgi:hypothetical protein